MIWLKIAKSLSLSYLRLMDLPFPFFNAIYVEFCVQPIANLLVINLIAKCHRDKCFKWCSFTSFCPRRETERERERKSMWQVIYVERNLRTERSSLPLARASENLLFRTIQDSSCAATLPNLHIVKHFRNGRHSIECHTK